MEVKATQIDAVKHIQPRRIRDTRGFFSEVWNERALTDAGIHAAFIQENHSYSERAGTVRGLHFQAPPMAQAKLIRVGRGEILDVAVDIRRGSPTYGQHCRAVLSAANGHQLFIPPGFLHGFVTLCDDVDVYYLVTAHWSAPSEGAVRWNDPDLGIDWGIDPADAKLSDKDALAPFFANFDTPFAVEGAP